MRDAGMFIGIDVHATSQARAEGARARARSETFWGTKRTIVKNSWMWSKNEAAGSS